MDKKAVTIEALTAAGLGGEEAKRILELYNAPADPAETEEAEEPPEAEGAGEAETGKNPVADEPAETKEAAQAESAEETAEEQAPEQEAGESEKAEQTEEAEESTEKSEAGDSNGLLKQNELLRARLLEVGTQACALSQGVKPERMGALMKLADLSAIDPTADEALAQIADAVKQALGEVPELAGASVTTGALGAHPRGNAQPIDAFARGLGGL